LGLLDRLILIFLGCDNDVLSFNVFVAVLSSGVEPDGLRLADKFRCIFFGWDDVLSLDILVTLALLSSAVVRCGSSGVEADALGLVDKLSFNFLGCNDDALSLDVVVTLLSLTLSSCCRLEAEDLGVLRRIFLGCDDDVLSLDIVVALLSSVVLRFC